jgi:uncharacterized membrane protein
MIPLFKENLFDDFLSRESKNRIEGAIAKAEKSTSGEIRVHVVRKANIGEALSEAKKWFLKLKMQNTRQRNAVLLYIAPNAKKFAIVGDTGIHKKIKDKFWKKTRDELQVFFKKEQYEKGIITAVASVGKVLKRFFPAKPGDINELSNKVTRS